MGFSGSEVRAFAERNAVARAGRCGRVWSSATCFQSRFTIFPRYSSSFPTAHLPSPSTLLRMCWTSSPSQTGTATSRSCAASSGSVKYEKDILSDRTSVIPSALASSNSSFSSFRPLTKDSPCSISVNRALMSSSASLLKVPLPPFPAFFSFNLFSLIKRYS
jgi:hypothetical protein